MSPEVTIATDYDRPSFVRVGQLYERTLLELGFTVQHVSDKQLLEDDSTDSDIILHNTWGMRFNAIPGKRNIALVVHEWSRYPSGWISALDAFDEIWVTTKHVKELLLRSSINPPVYWLPPAIDLEPWVSKSSWNHSDTFKFLYVGEHHFRKGLHILLEAWQRGFTSVDGVSLTIKTSPGFPMSNLPGNVQVIEGSMSSEELNTLMVESDAYISTSLGEGWGLPIVEAIRAQLPISTHLWGGHGSTLTADSTWVIPHQSVIQPYCSKPELFAPGQQCAWCHTVDVIDTMNVLLNSNPDSRAYKAKKAKEFLLDSYSLNKVAPTILERVRR